MKVLNHHVAKIKREKHLCLCLKLAKSFYLIISISLQPDELNEDICRLETGIKKPCGECSVQFSLNQSCDFLSVSTNSKKLYNLSKKNPDNYQVLIVVKITTTTTINKV